MAGAVHRRAVAAPLGCGAGRRGARRVAARREGCRRRGFEVSSPASFEYPPAARRPHRLHGLTLDVAVAVDFFGFARTITTPIAATYKWVWRTRHGKHKHVRVIRTIASTSTSDNPEISSFRWYTQAIHNGLPVQYQGDCST